MRSRDSDHWWAVKLGEGFPGVSANDTVALTSNGCLIAIILGMAAAVVAAMALHAMFHSGVVGAVSTIALTPVAIVVFLNVVGRIEALLHRR